MRDVLHPLNAKTGAINWKVDFVERYDTPLPAFGMVCSPLIDGDDLYVQAGSGFVKLDKRNGKSIWRSLKDKGGMFGSAFSSPVIEEINGKPQVVVQTRTDLAAVNPQNGNELWKKPIKAFRGMNILTPTVIGNSIFTSSYGGKSYSSRCKMVRKNKHLLNHGRTDRKVICPAQSFWAITAIFTYVNRGSPAWI